MKKSGILFAVALMVALVGPAVTRGVPSTDAVTHPATAAETFDSADYSGIMVVVSPSDDPDLFYADQALNGTIYAWPGLEPYHYEGEIDWGVGGRSDTWYLYFQSLRVVGYLANAAEASGNVSYLDKAAEIIESWFDFQDGNGAPPPFTWYDHTVADRSRNIMHFLRAYCCLQNTSLPGPLAEKIYIMLQEHGSWLLGEANYHPNNHGMMASMALTQLALTFPGLNGSEVWKDTGIERIRERIKADLSAENVHMEQSAAYHIFFLGLVLQVEQYLQAKGMLLFEPGDRTIGEMEDYLAYLVKPDGHLPMIGDTSDGALRESYNNPWIMYSLSAGEEGTGPPSNSVVYPDAGIAILRDEWKTGSAALNTTYLFFQCAFHSVTHKHADDLGFLLYSHGEDIFVGPGVYAYDNSKYRKYARSAQAHNTLTVDGESYVLSTDNIGKSNITAYALDGAFDFVQGSHAMYEGVMLKRGIVFIRPDTILVVDEAVSGAEHSIQQIWNLSPSAHDLEFDSSGASFLVGENDVYVEMRQLGPTIGVNHYYGQDEPVRGFMSPRQRELVPVHQLEFESDETGIVFVTQISVAGSVTDVPIVSVDLSDPYRTITIRYSVTIDLDSILPAAPGAAADLP